MAIISYIEAINQAFKEEMRRDKRVVLWGEDLISKNGVHGYTRDLFDEFGDDRIKDTPIAEQAIAGMAMGAAYCDLRPIGFFSSLNFAVCAFDGIFLQFGRNGAGMPAVLYGTIGGAGSDGGSIEALCIHAPYLKVVMPSVPYDAKGLMKTAIREDNPVFFLDNTMCYGRGNKDGAIERGANVQEVPEEEYLIPFGEADIKREGSDITLVTYSAMVHVALAAAYNLAKEGVNVEVVDLRTIVPLDVETVVKSAKKTGRLLIVHEAMKRGGVAGEIIFRVNEEAPDLIPSLKTPFRRLAAMNLPLMGPLYSELIPSVESVMATVKEMVKG